jgi:asparagine synthase (glutamine-hydrolysing)
MCSIIFTNKNITDLDYVNHYQKFRGPDATSVIEDTENGFTFVHNLLSITGELREQPFVKDNVVCIFNGEIYNYKDFGDYGSDGDCLVDLYLEYGDSFVKKLDGEFAILLIDYNKKKLIVSTDVFATKPLWISFDGGVGVASYHSALERLGFHNIRKVNANTTEIYSLEEIKLIKKESVFDFDLEQHIDSYDRWNEAFVNSIRKRSEGVREKIFIGLSSGYDSGAIGNELYKQNVSFKSYSIIGKENEEVLKDRYEILKNTQIIRMDMNTFNEVKHYLDNCCENYLNDSGGRMLNDKAAAGLGYISNLANKEGYRIYLSGQGADEIISNYGWNGYKIYPHSQFGGYFPEDLSDIFPWESFYEGTQIDYINKEECVAGTYGIETRYPFLDVKLVQEFLWLTQDLKNRRYKSVIAEYLDVNNFPFDENAKCGFNPTLNYYQPIRV